MEGEVTVGGDSDALGGILRGEHLGLGVERLHHAAHGVGEEVGAGDSLQIERLLNGL